ncbi:quinone-dependent dihydroorotate dehydrogenase [Haladaptatus caseinilyticus]|uniref:quinone-dependent dihydroorotate dehydrogenase n=1 Tax=Haladaptatus caseinilyticus TaxID=2993314 RepID=UPI00224A49F4|nr:quinone-dependent dihydroorotate dehydrogenase [Haladaptatus caseinilyticus]
MHGYDAVRPLLFQLPAETAHGTVHTVLEAIQGTPVERLLDAHYGVDDAKLTVSAFDQSFPNPVGVAAGFDKNAQIPSALASLGFGHVEIGGVTADAQDGNPKPRMFRLREDEGIINRMGFNNHGADRIGARMATQSLPDIPIGANIGKSKATPLESAEEDYLYSYERVSAHADYFVVNVSSPNTPGLRELQNRENLERILTTLQDAGASPLLVKLSPDLPESATEEALDLVTELGLDGVIATNTTIDRPNTLRSQYRKEDGGLSGRPIQSRATEMIRFAAERVDVPVVGVGGVFTAEDAYRKIRAGAHVIQLYTGLVYRGPAVARDINEGLLELLDRDGFDSVEDAIGADLD